MEEFKEQQGRLLEEREAVEGGTASSSRRASSVPVAMLTPYQFPEVGGILV